VEDAAASLERCAQAAVVQDVGAAQGQPLLGPIELKQVRVLAVRFNNQSHDINQTELGEIWNGFNHLPGSLAVPLTW
jgi:hypothetical protein